jgi:hypothetical protein
VALEQEKRALEQKVDRLDSTLSRLDSALSKFIQEQQQKEQVVLIILASCLRMKCIYQRTRVATRSLLLHKNDFVPIAQVCKSGIREILRNSRRKSLCLQFSQSSVAKFDEKSTSLVIDEEKPS